jgi:16S rRNA (cytosine1402-N4)-methyltransferase
MENNTHYHIPVMLQECMLGLNVQDNGIYVDVTFGGGGHAKELFSRISSTGQLIAFDQDEDAYANRWEAPNFNFIRSNFRFLENHLAMLGIKGVDGILADLGVSSHQFDVPERGFSLRENAALDMRMNKNSSLTAAHVLNDTSENDLYKLFRSYSDIQNPGKLIQNILHFRMDNPFLSTGDLVKVASLSAPRNKENKYLAQVFQAIRIEVNQELDALKDLLEQTARVLNPGGRLVVMSYHSLEDRLVKNFVKRGSFSGEIEKDFFGNILKPFEEITRHPLVASEEELIENPRSRSAKLRIAEKK